MMIDFQRRRSDGEITDRQAFKYLDGLKGRVEVANAEGLLFANNAISRERSVVLTMRWSRGRAQRV